jgi:ankyrin repeat protein
MKQDQKLKMLFDLQTLVKKSSSSSRLIDDILSYRNAEGATPLHIASANGYQIVVEYLLQQHVSVNLQDADGWTPIHAAAFWCQQPILGRRFIKIQNKSKVSCCFFL